MLPPRQRVCSRRLGDTVSASPRSLRPHVQSYSRQFVFIRASGQIRTKTYPFLSMFHAINYFHPGHFSSVRITGACQSYSELFRPKFVEIGVSFETKN